MTDLNDEGGNDSTCQILAFQALACLVSLTILKSSSRIISCLESITSIATRSTAKVVDEEKRLVS